MEQQIAARPIHGYDFLAAAWRHSIAEALPEISPVVGVGVRAGCQAGECERPGHVRAMRAFDLAF